jgi:acetyl esterase
VGDPDVAELRAHARQRAARRPRPAFLGTIEDLELAAVRVRRYRPTVGGGPAVAFLHGGYGIFGDLELQDVRCRQLAGALSATVLSVDYRLAPEADFADAVADVLQAVDSLAGSHQPVLVSGDSAGAAVAVWAAARGTALIDGLLLTSPNLDLSLAHVDLTQPESADLALSRWAFSRWCRASQDALALPTPGAGFPATLIAVGSRDGLRGDAEAFVRSCAAVGVRHRLITVEGEGHGLSETSLGRLWGQARDFFALTTD